MQVICPNCGHQVTAENINIQQMVAVCPNCHSVFRFDVSESKIKQRKVKKPYNLTADDAGGGLRIAFRTNFRLFENEPFLISMGISIFFTLMTAFIMSQISIAPMTLGAGLAALVAYYWLALIVFNKTHIEVNDEEIRVSRKPLPNLLIAPNTISRSGIKNIHYEETVISKREGYDVPRYNVWAETVDGNRKIIVSEVIEDYAVFISQRLNEFIEPESAPEARDVSRLLDDQAEAENGHEVISQSESSNKG